MKYYLDTSVVVSFFVSEIRTAPVRDWLSANSSAEILISEWTLTEFHSTLALKLRTNQISAEIKAEVEYFMVAATETIFRTIAVSIPDFRRAATLASNPDLWLRAGDALNLAIAEREAAVLCTLDKRLFAAAAQTGIAASMP